MSRAVAPGKAVLSGAYAVLHGAPALVLAVDRWALADTSRPAERRTPELDAALAGEAPPWFDARALRDGQYKLGLGSSAAILVACLAARELDRSGPLPDHELCQRVLDPAIAAHRAAQGGGSGIDVATSALGGVVAAVRHGPHLRAERVALPPRTHVTLWFTGGAASTPDLVARVAELGRRDPARHATLIGALSEAAGAARRAVTEQRLDDLVSALHAQRRGLHALGLASGAPIVGEDVNELADLAAASGQALLPSGAGGGDIVISVGSGPPRPELVARATALGFRDLGVALAARGVHALDDGADDSR